MHPMEYNCSSSRRPPIAKQKTDMSRYSIAYVKAIPCIVTAYFIYKVAGKVNLNGHRQGYKLYTTESTCR